MASKSVANGNFAPAYKAIRTDRWLLIVYANGQSELYDMKKDPAQQLSRAGDPRYKRVRRFLARSLTPLVTCGGDTCRTEIGPDPKPRGKGGKPKRRTTMGDPRGTGQTG